LPAFVTSGSTPFVLLRIRQKNLTYALSRPGVWVGQSYEDRVGSMAVQSLPLRDASTGNIACAMR